MPLLKVEPPRDNDVHKFQRHWNYVFAGLRDLPDSETMESIYCDRLRESSRLTNVLQMYERKNFEGHYGRSVQRDYETIWNMVNEHLALEEQEAADSNSSMAAAASTNVDESTVPWSLIHGLCANWVNKGHCFNASCPFQHYRNMRGQK